MMGLPEGRKCFKIGLVVLIQYRLWQTQPPMKTDTLPYNTRDAYRCIAPKKHTKQYTNLQVKNNQRTHVKNVNNTKISENVRYQAVERTDSTTKPSQTSLRIFVCAAVTNELQKICRSTKPGNSCFSPPMTARPVLLMSCSQACIGRSQEQLITLNLGCRVCGMLSLMKMRPRSVRLSRRRRRTAMNSSSPSWLSIHWHQTAS